MTRAESLYEYFRHALREVVDANLSLMAMGLQPMPADATRRANQHGARFTFPDGSWLFVGRTIRHGDELCRCERINRGWNHD